ncbi:MAG TPA: serine/threonine-protein kinase [Polyangia bacterium]|nr:serine/threonine-protein kinase [Polyangia bacterium]
MFGRYQLVERIAVGGMAEIYRGRMIGVGGFEKPVAIKKILPRLARDERFIKLLMNEAKINASLSHANIVQINDLGLNEAGEYFLVLEYVDGRDLRAILDAARERRSTVSREVALFIGGEVCEALEHAHRLCDSDGKPLGLVHRDVSPANILVSYAGEVKLTDFGIAKQLKEASLVTTLKGKFGYMSPEQARSLPVDQKSDLFSLGAILYEMLLGRKLFEGTDFEVLQAVRDARIVRPRDVRPDFPPGLEQILLKALAPRPRDRWESAALFGAALREFRFAMTSGGGGAPELAAWLAKLFPPGRRPTDPPSEFITINTVAGFRPPDSLPTPTPTPTPVAVTPALGTPGRADGPNPMTPAFDVEPTAVADPLARSLDAAVEPFAQLIDLRPVVPERASPDAIAQGDAGVPAGAGAGADRGTETGASSSARPSSSGDSGPQRAGEPPPPPSTRASQARLLAQLLLTPAPEDEPPENAPFQPVEEDQTTGPLGGVSAQPPPEPRVSIEIASSDLVSTSTTKPKPGQAQGEVPGAAPAPKPHAPAPPLRLRPRRWPYTLTLGLLAVGAGAWALWRSAAPMRSELLVESEPAGATVLVDGVALPGVTPLKTVLVRDEREHEVELRQIDRWSYRTVARADRSQIAVRGRLDAARVGLEVKSQPAGARVTVDGVRVCETPCTVRRVETRRRHRLRMTLGGYAAWEEEVEVSPQGLAPIDAKLVALAGVGEEGAAGSAVRRVEEVGRLDARTGDHHADATGAHRATGDVVLKSDPWARIVVDGKDIGRNTSAATFKLPVGKHDIMLVNPPLKLKKSFAIVVRADEATRKFVPLR